MENLKYKRVLLKISGEALAGTKGFGFDNLVMEDIVDTLKEIKRMGVEVAIVVGGGNFFRGRSTNKIKRTSADYIGMMATVMNGIALRDVLESSAVASFLVTASHIAGISSGYQEQDVMEALGKGEVVIFAGGTGHPYFTTDTAAVLRALEIDADVILLGKSIDAIYSDDPKINKDAIKYDDITYDEVLEKDLKVMDITATSMGRENNIPIQVFAIENPHNILKILKGEKIGTSVHN